MINDSSITPSSGNVFADLGVSDPEAALVKAELARQIDNAIRERGLTQTQAADLMGIDQPKVSALLRGRLSGFSTERLCRFLVALGHDVTIAVSPRRVEAAALRVKRGRGSTRTSARPQHSGAVK
jgi:predicted XRE-type DNA-binding protein